jgi:hypothetical protein
MARKIQSQRGDGQLLVGWSTCDTTPSRPVMLRGQFYTRISTHVNDPITATALALEATTDDGDREQLIMVSCDRVSIPWTIQERVREAVQPELPDFDPNKLFLFATHTHTAPEIEEGFYLLPEGESVMTPTEYADFFVERVSEAVIEAWKSRNSGGVSWAFGHAVVGHNRRAHYFDGTSRMYGATDDEQFDSIEGYEDHSVDLLFLWDERSELTGIVINLACPSQVTESELYISADFWHEVRVELRERYSSELFVLPQCAPAGDQSPHLLLYRKAEEYMRSRRGVSERQEIARRIANAIDDVIALARSNIHTQILLKHIVTTVQLPARRITEEEFQLARSEYERLSAKRPSSEREASSIFVHMRRNRDVMERYASQAERPFFPIELHVIRLGDVAIATNPFELFLDFGLRIKARSKALQTFLIQLACDAAGYLPTAKAVAAKGYGAEAASNLVGPEGGQVLVNETVKLINSLWES